MTIKGFADYLKAHDNYIIVTHDGPDADGIGAAYALALTLEAIGKTAIAAVSDKVPVKIRFIDRRGLFRSLAAGANLPFPAREATLIIVDTQDSGYLGERAAQIISSAKCTLIIDHHEPMAEPGELTLLDPSASSSCELVYLIAQALGVELPIDAAEAVFAGIVYDTGSFAYPKTSERTFSCALELVKRGVKPYELHNRMYESSDSGVLLLQKAVISSLELELGGRVALQSLNKKDLAASGALFEDAEYLVNIPLQDKLVEVSVLFKENLEGKLRCSLRSKGGVNVALIAQAFGGGGHKTAAGFSCHSPLARAKDDVLQSIARSMQGRD
ncbi:MAG: bifunctional oligoribonuclease/PAP phosphatase NrnA [Rectinemataceae bacterium]|jgi:phosphoesterase RecJ-like protein